MRLSIISAAAAFMVAAAPAMAAEVAISLSIPVTGGTSVNSSATTYDCEGREVAVSYINAGEVALAVLDIEGRTVIAANVIAASGARYAGGRYVWWTTGDKADLYDLMDGGEDQPAAHCVTN